MGKNKNALGDKVGIKASSGRISEKGDFIPEDRVEIKGKIVKKEKIVNKEDKEREE